jgi:hypothetical protein
MQCGSLKKNILYGALFLLTLLIWFHGHRFLYLDVKDPQGIFLGVVILSIIFTFLINSFRVSVIVVILFWIISIIKVFTDAGCRMFAIIIFDTAILIAHIFLVSVLYATREFIVSKWAK